MENGYKHLALHPKLLEALFAFKGEVSQVFKEVLGLHGIDHIALTKINANNELITFSSTPSLEFNLFSSFLWRYDKSYHPAWFETCSHSYWPGLYSKVRFDELYYAKQIKHGFPVGLSMARQINNEFYIYSLASRQDKIMVDGAFSQEGGLLYDIGHYCSSRLQPLFLHCDSHQYKTG